MYQKLDVRIQGVAPILLHNGRTANPLDPLAREMKRVTGKRKKTDADYQLLSDLEWFASLYTTEEVSYQIDGYKLKIKPNGAKLCLPPEVIEGALINAAKKARRGDAFKSGGVVVEEPAILELRSQKTLADMLADQSYRDVRGVRVQRNRIMRTRARFNVWSATLHIMWLNSVVEKADVMEAITTAGQFVGVGDFRPRFGRFVVSE